MIFHEYETIYVTRPELPEAETKRLHDRFRAIIAENHGTILADEDWGRRKLAYPIKKHHSGHYTYINYVGPADLPREFERVLRLEDNLIRFLTVRLAEHVDPEERRAVAEERKARRAEALGLGEGETAGAAEGSGDKPADAPSAN